MKKYIEKIKRQANDEAMKSGLVVIGAVGGLLLAKGLNKLTEDQPNINSVVKYATPILLAGGGFILASATDQNQNVKYFGYGLTVAGTIEGVKLIPVAKEYLSGILGDTEISAANAFLTESEERQKLMNGFGMTSLPVGKATLQNANNYETNLPELEGAVEGLGYNSSTTDDVDPVSGIL